MNLKYDAWDGLPEFSFESAAPAADCAARFIDAHRRLGFQLKYDGERIVASWVDCEEGDPECRKKLQYSAEADLVRGTVVIYVYDRRKRKLCKSSLLPPDINALTTLAVGKRAVRFVDHTQRVTDDIYVVPVYVGMRPYVVVVDRKGGAVRHAPSFDAGDAVYMAAPSASLGVLPPAGSRLGTEERERLLAAIAKIARYGPEVTLLSLLPYLHPHARKRHVPVLVGPMREGKTETAHFAFSHWPQPKHTSSVPSSAGLRNMLALHHVFADDTGEDPDVRFSWRIVIPYFDRHGIPRGSPLNPRQYVMVYMRGALLVATNNPADDIRSVQDRVRYFYPPERVVREKPAGEPYPELAWLAACPALLKLLPPWFSALDEGYANLLDIGQSLGIWPPDLRPLDPPKFEPHDDPFRAFLYQLYTKLTRLVRQAEDFLRDAYRGDAQLSEEEWRERLADAICNMPRHVKWRQRGKSKVHYAIFKLNSFRNPLYRSVEYAESVAVRVSKDTSSSGVTVTRRAAAYSASHARQILRVAGLDAYFSVMMFGTNHYVAVPCGRVLEALKRLEEALRKYGVELAEEGEPAGETEETAESVQDVVSQ
jgi:hypothetical protein